MHWDQKHSGAPTSDRIFLNSCGKTELCDANHRRFSDEAITFAATWVENCGYRIERIAK